MIPDNFLQAYVRQVGSTAAAQIGAADGRFSTDLAIVGEKSTFALKVLGSLATAP